MTPTIAPPASTLPPFVNITPESNSDPPIATSQGVSGNPRCSPADTKGLCTGHVGSITCLIFSYMFISIKRWLLQRVNVVQEHKYLHAGYKKYHQVLSQPHPLGPLPVTDEIYHQERCNDDRHTWAFYPYTPL